MQLRSKYRQLKNALLHIIWHSALRNKFNEVLILKCYKLLSFGNNNSSILPIVWLDTINKRTLLRTGVKSISYAPHFLENPQIHINVNLPDIYYYIFRYANVSATSSSVIVNKECIIIERAAVPNKELHNYAAGHIRLHDEKKAVVNSFPLINLSCGIFLAGNGSSNYYHWMLELLTKFEFISKLPSQYQSYPLLINEDIISTTSLKETLDIISRSQKKLCELYILKKNCGYIVDNLIYINTANSLPFNLRGKVKFKCEYSSIDNKSIKFLRENIFSEILQKSNRDKYGENIFLCRKNVRRNYNQDEVSDVLFKYGFKDVFMEDLSFIEQVKTINQARFIVGPTGAAWTNLVFASPGSKALCWMAKEAHDFSVYSNIAQIIGIDLRYITYQANTLNTGDIYAKDYTLDIIQIELGLKALGLQHN